MPRKSAPADACVSSPVMRVDAELSVDTLKTKSTFSIPVSELYEGFGSATASLSEQEENPMPVIAIALNKAYTHVFFIFFYFKVIIFF